MTTLNTTTPDATEPREYSHREILQVMTGLLATLFTAMISTTIISTALPTIMADLNGTQRQYTWVITASLLAMTIATPIWGKLSDLFDKKILAQLSIVMFVAGYMGAVMAVATVSGPLLGGVITDAMNWRWCFFVSVPLAIRVELQAPEPMIPIRVLRNKTAAWMIAASVGAGVGMFGAGVFLTQYFQLGVGVSPTRAGLMIIPLIVAQMLSATIGGQIVSRIGRWKPVMMLGGAIGVAILGAVLTSRVSGNIAEGLQKLGTTQAAAFGSPGETELDISGLPASLQQLFHNAYADAFGPVFLIAALISAVTVLAVAIVRGTALRTTIDMRPVSQNE